MTSLIPKEVKYIAICEGDDYWVDPLKLQKQVDFLEQNSEYGMVYGKVRVWLQEDNRFGGSFGKKLRTFEELLRYNTIPTLTVVYRHVLDQQYVEEIEPSTKKWRMGDYPKWLYFSKKSDIGFIDEYFGVYRVNRVSASHFADRVGHLKFQINALEIALYMCDKFGEEKHLTEIRLLWSNLEYSYLISDKELLENTQRDIARASLWPLSFRMIILKLFYKHPEMYLKSKMITKKMLHIKL